MDININDYINTATQKYYGQVSPTRAQELWGAFCETISTPTKEFLAVIASTDTKEVRSAISDLIQGAIAKLVAEGEIPPEHASSEVQQLIDTLAEKLVTYRDQPELEGLISTNKDIVYATLVALCSDLTLTQALTSLLARAAATIAERGAGLPTLYLDFLAHMVESAQRSEATVALSPREDEIRRIMFEVFNLALEMVRILQRSSVLQGNLLYYYSKVQREYTDMMAKTQMYGPTANQYIIADSTDFGNTKLGYGNITVRNITDYLIKQLDADPSATYKMYEHGYDSNFLPCLKFWLNRTADGGYFLDIECHNSDRPNLYHLIFSTRKTNADRTNFGANQPVDNTQLYYPSTNLGGAEQRADLVNQLMYHLTRQWNETPDSYAPDGAIIYYENYATIGNFSSLKYYWGPAANSHWMYNIYFSGPTSEAYKPLQTIPPDASEDEKKEINEANAKLRQESATFRSEANALLQIYMENTRALKDLAKEASKRSESVLTQLKEALQNQSNFLSAITECLRGMLSAIFR